MNTIIIPTTQNIELEYPVAHLGDRIVAGIIDTAVLFTYIIIWNWFLTEYGEYSSFEDYTSSTVSILSFLPAAFYSLWTELFFNGRTLGKLIMKTRTIRTDGAPPTISNYLIRWILKLVDVWLSVMILIPGIVGMITILINKKGQRLGDLAAGTTVIKLKLVTTFGDTIFMHTGEDYEVVFPEIQTLSDRDVSILKEVLDAGVKSSNPMLLDKLATKVKEVAGITSTMSDRAFLETILRDYNHVYGRS